MILSGVLMLRYLTLFKEAAMIENAVMATLEEGKTMPRDVVGDAKAASTTAYTDAIIANFGKVPSRARARDYKPIRMPEIDKRPDFVRPTARRVVGVDVFIESALSPDEIGKESRRWWKALHCCSSGSSRGTKSIRQWARLPTRLINSAAA
jgi:isocitrate dehydrogenase